MICLITPNRTLVPFAFNGPHQGQGKSHFTSERRKLRNFDMTFENHQEATPSQALPAELHELGQLLENLDSPEHAELKACYGRVAESVLRRRRILNLVQEALSQLRLDVKYLMFDLEMTRRERDELQQQIEDDERS